MKTVTYQNEISPGSFPKANISVSNQGAVTAISSGANFLSIDLGLGSYSLNSTDSVVVVTGTTGQLFLALPDTNSCYLGQEFKVLLKFQAGIDFQTSSVVISSNNGEKFDALNFYEDCATYYCASVGDNAATGWVTSHVQDYYGRATIESPAATTVSGGTTVIWDTVEHNTLDAVSGNSFFEVASNGFRIPKDGRYEFHIKFLCVTPNSNKVGLLLSRDGNKTEVSYHVDNPNSEDMSLEFSTQQTCYFNELWDVRAWNQDMDIASGQRWYYQFICRRIRY